MSDPNAFWDPDFGNGISVEGPSGGVRITAQGAVGASGSEIVYQDEGGRFATLGGLSRDETNFLVDKHDL